MNCGFDGCECGDPLNHPFNREAEARARHDVPPKRIRLGHISRTSHIDREDRNPYSDGAEEGNDSWGLWRGESR